MYYSKMVAVVQHLEVNKLLNVSLQFTVEQEQNYFIRLKKELLEN